MSFTFVGWPKTKRLFRECVVSEKIDGANGAIHIAEDGTIGAQSRNRLLLPGKTPDNFGFATWVHEHKEALFEILGPGLHFGEWWGGKIQRGYGRKEKTFSLFNTKAWRGLDHTFTDGTRITSVPILYEGVFDEAEIRGAALMLEVEGSQAAPGYMNPEGICIFLPQLGVVTKYTLDGDGHKGEVAS